MKWFNPNPSEPWRSAVFRASRGAMARDDLSHRLNDAHLHVIDVGDGSRPLIEVRYNPLQYSVRRIAERLAACGVATAVVLETHGLAATRSLWIARG
jgi:hypothetical protein